MSSYTVLIFNPGSQIPINSYVTSSPATSSTATGLTGGTEYGFEVEANNAIGTGTPSTEVFATPTGPPGAPSGLSATAGNAAVSLSWSAPSSNGGSAISSYTVLVLSPGSTTPISTTATGSTATTMTAGGLTNGMQYGFEIEAQNAAGLGPPSGEVFATPVAPPAPSPPVGGGGGGGGGGGVFLPPATGGGTGASTVSAITGPTGPDSTAADSGTTGSPVPPGPPAGDSGAPGTPAAGAPVPSPAPPGAPAGPAPVPVVRVASPAAQLVTGGVQVAITCPTGSCSGNLELTERHRVELRAKSGVETVIETSVVAAGHYLLRAGADLESVPLTAFGRRSLHQLRATRAVLDLVVTVAGGKTSTAAVRLGAPRGRPG